MDVHEAIRTSRSVRSYSPRPIEPDKFQHLLQALRYAPSACNFQPWQFVLIQDQDLRRRVALACNEQKWMAQAPLIVVGCGLSDQAYKTMGGKHNTADIDVTIALDHLTLAAVAQGLGSCWIGAFDEQAVKDAIAVPDDVRVVALMPVGYPTSPELNHPLDESRRRPAADVFSTDSYL